MAAKIRMVITETAVNAAANTSTVKAVLQYYGNGTSYNGYSSQCKINMYVNGNHYTGNHTFTKSKSWQTLKTVTGITVPHNADGTKTMSYSASFATGVSLGTLKTSGSVALTSIARNWTVSYDAYGGTGAPAAQTKAYGVTLTLSSIIPTRTGYRFLGWSTTAGGGVSYYAGGAYTANAGATLYAVWELAYLAPEITTLNAVRISYSGGSAVYDEEGYDIAVNYVYTPAKHYENGTWVDVTDTPTLTITIGDNSFTPTSSPFYTTTGDYDIGTEYKVTFTVSYTLEGIVYSASKETFISPFPFTFDVSAYGKSIAFGKSAPDDETNYWQGVFLTNVNGNTNFSTALAAKGLSDASVEEILTYILNRL